MNLLDLKTTKKTYSMVSLVSFRYGDKTTALNKCMVIFCLLFIFKKKEKAFYLPALCQSVRLYCEVIQPSSQGFEW